MEGFTKPSDTTKKEKQKSKEGGHSLLQVFTNPLLHAIPILARNCLNFEDFVAQTSYPDRNGLLGPIEDMDERNEGDMTLSPMIKSDTPWHIRVLGLPHMGAKSRVETQIKIRIQLADSQGELATNWSHIKLPEYLVAKDKLKRRNPKYGIEEKPTLIDSNVLSLEASVVCDSHPEDQIIMCPSCVHRELKRLRRKRDNKMARAANKEGGEAKLAALLSANELPDLSDDLIMEEERKRILLFNCSELVEFNSGEAIIPTRITCYCRHHSEKIGFRIVFVLKDSADNILASGRSPPIMITDDHKSSKMQQSVTRKRPRNEMDTSANENDAPRKRIDFDIDSGVSSPITSTPATPSSLNEETIPENNDQRNESIDTIKLIPGENSNEKHALLDLPTKPNDFFSTHNPYIQTENNAMELSSNELYDFLNSNDINMLHTPAKDQSLPKQPLSESTNNNHIKNLPHHNFNQNLLQQQYLLTQFSHNSSLLNSRNKKNNAQNAIPSASIAWKCMLEKNKEEINSRIQELLKEVEEWEATKRTIDELLKQ